MPIIAPLCLILLYAFVWVPYREAKKIVMEREFYEKLEAFKLITVRRYYKGLKKYSFDEIKEKYNVEQIYNMIGRV